MKARLLAAVVASTITMPAFAAAPVADPLAGLQAMRELNAIVLGDAKGWLAVEGKTFIAGNLQNAGTFGAGNASYGHTASDRATLTVGGNVQGSVVQLNNGSNGGSGNVNANASMLVGGNLSGLQLNNNNSVVKAGGTLGNVNNGTTGSVLQSGGAGIGYRTGTGYSHNLGSAFSNPLNAGIQSEVVKLDADLKALSLSLASQGATAGNSIVNNYGARVLNAVNNGSGYSIFTLSEADLSAWDFKLNVSDPATTVVFNILGDGSYNWNSALSGAFGNQFAGNVIWNFSDATSLNISQTVYGSVLAPFANLVANSAIFGTVVADDATLRSGAKLGTYDGSNLGFMTEAVPEPKTWAMLILGFGLVGVTSRRRREGGFQRRID